MMFCKRLRMIDAMNMNDSGNAAIVNCNITYTNINIQCEEYVDGDQSEEFAISCIQMEISNLLHIILIILLMPEWQINILKIISQFINLVIEMMVLHAGGNGQRLAMMR